METTALAQLIDHTLLAPEATPFQVAALCTEAEELGVYAVCVSPSLVVAARPHLTSVRLATVCGFPSGAHRSEVKAFEAQLAVEDGADEVDMVADLAALKAGRVDLVEADVRSVRDAIPHALLKVILETALLTPEEIEAACRACVSAGANYVKTSTGFSPAGGASLEAVRLMRSVVPDGVGVKASGGIRTRAEALAMVEAGATRLGLSRSRAILADTADQISGSY